MPILPDTAPQPIADAPTFANKNARQVVSCRVCGRTLLIGERSIGYFTASGEGPYDVCELCVPRAHRYGLRPRQYSADEIAAARRGSLIAHLSASVRDMVGGTKRTRRARPARRTSLDQPVASQGTAAVAAAAATPQRSGPLAALRARRAVAAAPLDPAALGAVPVGAAAIPIALAAFNQSPHARTLAGLHRTLGAPRANVQPRSATDREVILTVAWEIVWYQFRVMPDGIQQQSGSYLGELAPRWQRWNCVVAADGTVREADAAPAAGATESSPGKEPGAPSIPGEGSAR